MVEFMRGIKVFVLSYAVTIFSGMLLLLQCVKQWSGLQSETERCMCDEPQTEADENTV